MNIKTAPATRAKTSRAGNIIAFRKTRPSHVPTPFQVREEVEIIKRVHLVISFPLPRRVEAMLIQGNKYVHIPAAEIGTGERGINGRIHNWENPFRSGSISTPSNRKLRDALVKEGCDTTAYLATTREQWERLQTLAARLGITPADWLIGAAGYQAMFKERGRA